MIHLLQVKVRGFFQIFGIRYYLALISYYLARDSLGDEHKLITPKKLSDGNVEFF